MPFRIRDGLNFTANLDFDVTEQTKPEAQQKAEQIRDYYMKQDTLMEQYNALNEISSRNAALMTYGDTSHNGDLKGLTQELGYQIEGGTARETKTRNDACNFFAANIVKDLSGLKNLFISQGMLQAGYKAEMELERQKYLKDIPENDPLREQKADYLVLHSDGAYYKHISLRGTTTMITDEFQNVSVDAYEEFSEQFRNRKKKDIGEMSLRELAEELEIPEERREAFYRKFDSEGVSASPDDKFTAAVTAKCKREEPRLSDDEIKLRIAGTFYNEFAAEMIEKGIRTARDIMPRKKQELMDAGRRYEKEMELRKQEQDPDLKAWIRKEGKDKALQNSLENLKNEIIRTDKTVLKNSKKGGVPLYGSIDKIGLLDSEGAYCLSYNKMEQARKKLQNAQTPEEKNTFAAEFLLAKQIHRCLTDGEIVYDYPPYKIEAMRQEIRTKILDPMQAENLTGQELAARLDEPEQLTEANRISERMDSRFRVSHEKYIALHTGENAGKTPDEKVECLAKCLAAYALQQSGQKFSLKQIHKIAGHMKKIYSLDSLKQFPDKLNQSLQDVDSVLKTGRDMRNSVYGVTEENVPSYTQSMKELAKNMIDPKDHSKEYKKLVESVQKAAALERRMEGKSAQEKAEMIRQANLDIMEASEGYMKGKEKVRWGAEGNACFNNALDAVATVTKFAPGSAIRAGEMVSGINEIRNHGNPASPSYIDMSRLTENYGAVRAKQALAEAPGKFKSAPEGPVL